MIVFEKYSRLRKNFKGHSFWARGYYVGTVGLDEAKIRKYIQNQEINEEVEDKYDSDLSDPSRVARTICQLSKNNQRSLPREQS